MIVSSDDLKIKKVSEDGDIGVFSFEPLPKGFGHTLGNVLRRVLLTSIKGAAVTQIKIIGAKHQFSTIPGVKEDAVELGLNFKSLRFKNYADQPVVAKIEKIGPGVVTSKDIECPSDLEVVGNKIHIATLADKKTEFDVELTVETGYGYSPVEERESSKIGVILLDALYSPILRATYKVEPARFGKRTDLDKLVLTVMSDGSIAPKEAILEASGILGKFFARLVSWDKEPVLVEESNGEDTFVQVGSDVDISVDELPLPTRTINALKKAGIETLSKLVSKSDEEIADIKNVGEKSVVEIKKLLGRDKEE
jgi:DNA-directed RNA polymerase subunit alpha